MRPAGRSAPLVEKDGLAGHTGCSKPAGWYSVLLKGVAHFERPEALARVEVLAPEEDRTQGFGRAYDQGIPEGDSVALGQYSRGQDVLGIRPVIAPHWLRLKTIA